MTLHAKRRLNPLDDFDYQEEPYEVKDKFAIFVPKPRNELLMILKKHIEKQTLSQLSQSKEVNQMLAHSKKESSISEGKTPKNGNSRLREKLNGMLNESRNIPAEETNFKSVFKDLNQSGLEPQTQTQNIDKSITMTLNESQPRLLNPRNIIDESKGRSLSPNPNLSPSPKNENKTIDFNAEDVPLTKKLPEKKNDSPISFQIDKEKETLNEDKPSKVYKANQNTKMIDQPIKEKRINKETIICKEDPFVCEKPMQNPLKLPGIKPTRPSDDNKSVHSSSNKAKYALRSTISSFETPVPKDSTAARISRFSRSSEKKPRGISLDQALGENIIPLEQGPQGAFYGTLRDGTPQSVKHVARKSWNPSPDRASKTMTPTANSLSKQLQYDGETRTYVGALLKARLTEDIRKYEDLIMNNQPLLTGLMKLRDNRLLKQNPVLVRKFENVDRFSFIDSSHHTKNSSGGYSRSVSGGFYAR
mgnify:FL=1